MGVLDMLNRIRNLTPTKEKVTEKVTTAIEERDSEVRTPSPTRANVLAKVEKVLEERPPIEPEVFTKEDVSLKPGQSITVKYENSQGRIVTAGIHANDFARFQNSLIQSGGRIIKIESGDVRQGLLYSAPTTEEYKGTLREHYSKYGTVPKSFKDQFGPPIPMKIGSGVVLPNVPSDIYTTGLTDKYIQLSYETSIGAKGMGVAARELRNMFNEYSTIDWAKANMVFDNPLTAKKESLSWSDLKKDEPSLFLEKTRTGFSVVHDPVKWRNLESERAWKEKDWGYLAGSFFSDVFSPERVEHARRSLFESPAWTPAGSQAWTEYEKGIDRLYASGHYEYHSAFKDKDFLKIGSRVLSSPIGSTLTLYGAGKIFGLASLTSFLSKPVAYVGKHAISRAGLIGGGVTAIGGYQIGKSLLSAHSEGTLDKELGRMALTLPLNIASFYYGYRSGASYTPKTHIVSHKDMGVTVGRRYLFEYPKGTPRFYYGKTGVMSPESAWSFYQGYAPRGRTWWGESEIPQLSEFTQTRTNYLSYKPFQDVTYTSRWGSKFFVETGKGWSPKTSYEPSPFELSTRVWPKPKPFRAYETYYRFFYGQKPLVSIINRPVIIKPFKPFHKTAKDILKPDNSFKGVTTGTGGQQSILKPPKLVTETKTVVKTEKLGDVKLENRFKDLKQVYKTKNIQALKTVSGLSYIPRVSYIPIQLKKTDTKQRKAFYPLYSFKQADAQMQRKKLGKNLIYAPISLQAQAQSFAPVSLQTQLQTQAQRVDIAYIPVSLTKSPNKSVLFPFLPEVTLKGLKPGKDSDLFDKKYRFRKWTSDPFKLPDILKTRTKKRQKPLKIRF